MTFRGPLMPLSALVSDRLIGWPFGESPNYYGDSPLEQRRGGAVGSFGAFNEIAKLFPNLYGQPSASLIPGHSEVKGQSLKGGFHMIYSSRDKIETPEQLKQAEETVMKLDLDGLVIIGGDDSNTNACVLAENLRYNNIWHSMQVIRLMGRAASHITLECALQTHPKIVTIGEEVS
ncbi:hypothetical protein F3Y22_tig00001732pilonHSYRG00026 [Hibiscus syriacus]|uniref:Phosphofructokinase domain-containing protein n=1 Tax=Hibiscus syriacus TaxID=106335 RepID=A0A6A3CT77_HIBSY|nr:hypothetical protein F3Y22_tig00001732pilonHSYRG00026 [Hibiscus syriacus]